MRTVVPRSTTAPTRHRAPKIKAESTTKPTLKPSDLLNVEVTARIVASAKTVSAADQLRARKAVRADTVCTQP